MSYTWLTIEEAKVYWKKADDRTIIKMISNGEIYGRKLGGEWRICLEMSDQLIFDSVPKKKIFKKKLKNKEKKLCLAAS